MWPEARKDVHQPPQNSRCQRRCVQDWRDTQHAVHVLRVVQRVFEDNGAAPRVSHQKDRTTGLLGAHTLKERVEIVEVLAPRMNVAPLPWGASPSPSIKGVDGVAARHLVRGQIQIPAAVSKVAVQQDDHRSRLRGLWSPSLVIEGQSPDALKLTFVVFHALPFLPLRRSRLLSHEYKYITSSDWLVLLAEEERCHADCELWFAVALRFHDALYIGQVSFTVSFEHTDEDGCQQFVEADNLP